MPHEISESGKNGSKPSPSAETTSPERELSRSVNEGPFFNHPHQFTAMLATQFGRLDLNQDGEVSKLELDARTNAAAPKDDLTNTAKTLANHFDDMSKLLGKTSGGFTKADVMSWAKLTDPERCDNAPSFGGTMVRSTAGGVIGGGVTSKLQGGTFREGGEKGAAVGAAVGLVAYGVEKAQYNRYVQDRSTVDTWKEFSNDTCDVPTDLHSTPAPVEKPSVTATSPEVRTRGNMRFAAEQAEKLGRENPEGRLSETQIVEKLQNFKSEIPKLDADKDGFLSLDELAEGARGDKLSEGSKEVAVVLANNLELISQLNRDNLYSGSRLNYVDLETATKIYQKPTDSEIMNRRITVGMDIGTGGLIGCGAGAFVGFVFGGGVGAIPGCAAGAAVFGGGAGLISNGFRAKPDPLAKEFGQEPANKLRRELSFLK